MRNTLRALVACVAVLAIAFDAPPANAGSSPGTLNVTASVNQNCTIPATTTLAFGSYDPVVTNLSSALNVSTTIAVTCTKGASTIRLDMGATGNTGHCTGTTRCMVNSGHYLNYDLYQDSGHTTVWSTGTGSPGGETLSPASWGATNPDTVTIYGQIPGGQDANVSSGNYTDSITATINF